MTMFRDRAISSYQVWGGPSVSRYSGVWREREVNRFTYPSSVGSKTTLGG